MVLHSLRFIAVAVIKCRIWEGGPIRCWMKHMDAQ